TIGVLLAVTASMSSVAQDFMAKAGAPAEAFPNPGRPVADIVSPIWHNEKERDDAGEARQLVHLLGIKSGMTIADIGAGSGYYVERLSPSWARAAASSRKMWYPNICRTCANECVLLACKTSR